jgi:hypothetical protein
MSNDKQNSLTDLQLNDLEQWAWDNPCLSRSDVYNLFEEVFKGDKLTFDRAYSIGASRQVYDFKDKLRKLAKEKGELLKPTETSSDEQSSVEWLYFTMEGFIHKSARVHFAGYFEQAKEMHNKEKLTDYSDGYLEGFNRALALIELTVEEYKHDIFYDRGLLKIHDRIKKLKG